MVEFTIVLTETEIKQCERFATASANTQREHRTGGLVQRSYMQIFTDTFRGKIGEMAVKKFLEQPTLDVEGIELDFAIYPRGVWDVADITRNGIKISIKSSKHFARWLLLESKDIERGEVSDMYIFVLVAENFTSATIKGYATKEEITGEDKHTLHLRRGECIPRTTTPLDADNHARHADHLHNSLPEWTMLARRLRE